MCIGDIFKGALNLVGGLGGAISAPYRALAGSPKAKTSEEDEPLDPDSEEALAAARDAKKLEERRARARFGRGATLLTGGLGLEDQAPTKRPTLIGEA